jgi:hypothetical protein
MIVRVSARGQANGSADGYLCAREQLGQAKARVRKICALRELATLCGYQVLLDFNFGIVERFARDFLRARTENLHAVRGVWWGSKPRLARSRVPRYTGRAKERKPCSSRFVHYSLALWLGGRLDGVTLGAEHNVVHDKTSNI